MPFIGQIKKKKTELNNNVESTLKFFNVVIKKNDLILG